MESRRRVLVGGIGNILLLELVIFDKVLCKMQLFGKLRPKQLNFVIFSEPLTYVLKNRFLTSKVHVWLRKCFLRDGVSFSFIHFSKCILDKTAPLLFNKIATKRNSDGGRLFIEKYKDELLDYIVSLPSLTQVLLNQLDHGKSKIL